LDLRVGNDHNRTAAWPPPRQLAPTIVLAYSMLADPLVVVDRDFNLTRNTFLALFQRFGQTRWG